MTIRVNLGCGRDVRDGWLNVDQYAPPGSGIIQADVEDGLPFEDGSVDFVLASHVLEHVLRFDRTIAEIYRVLRSGGTLEVQVPYGWYGLENPYHRRIFNRRAVRQILAASNPDGVKSLEINEHWNLMSYRVRRRVVPWLHKPRVGRWDFLPFIYSRELTFVLEKA